MSSTGETVLLRLRTHPKVLFQPAFVQLVLIAAHIALYHFWPETTGYQWLDEWGQLALHAVILLVELHYVAAPALRWYNAQFTVTNHRLIETWGILYRNSREIPLERIGSVTEERGILDRIFGAGTLVFHDNAMMGMDGVQKRGLQQRSSDGRAGVRFHDVPRFFEVRKAIDEVRFPQAT